VQSRARGKRRKLFPIALTDNATLKKWERLDSATGEALAEAVRKQHPPDFSNWQPPAAFARAFARPALRRASAKGASWGGLGRLSLFDHSQRHGMVQTRRIGGFHDFLAVRRGSRPN